jgi:beta-xylosidase
MKKLAIVIILVLLFGCSPAAESPPDVEPGEPQEEVPIAQPPEPTPTQVQPTDTPEPTAPPEPTATLEPTLPPTSTPLPEGVIFRDDFEGYFQPGWSWINENPEKWAFVDFGNAKWLRIVGENKGGFGEERTNILSRSLPEGNFMITAHILANPRTNFQQANIFIYENPQNFIVMNFGFCDLCENVSETGHGYFMETFIENNPFDDVYAVPRGPEDTDVYLRLVNQGGSITGYYATEFGNWQRIGAFGNYFEFVSVGLGATNCALPEWQGEPIEALFDYFEIALP